ncbi:MAG: S8 family serine peptidase [Bacteroidales bacterium]|nr:S8 family serine peptidase [Bacteroidales bacterium]
MKISYALIYLQLIIPFLIIGQVAPDKYWVKFTDKNNTPFSIDSPEAFLSQKAIDRRTNQGIAIVENDLPVDPVFVAGVENTGATILNVSKWFNSVTIFANSPTILSAINALPYVSSVDALNGGTTVENSFKPFFKTEIWDSVEKDQPGEGTGSGESYNYGQAFNQINMLNGIALHDMGYDGAGMIIAVLDAGFLNADIIDAFDSLWLNNRILGYRDFADPLNPDIFGSHSHGTSVLSTMGANLPGEMVGTAPQASYYLLRTEDGGSEYIIEELNWVSGAEYADSVGADIINSSLGYTEFDDSSQDHTYQDMDGNTTPISIGADMAASKGILVVNSAGNSGNDSWQYIGAPADGDSVFSIGAVTGSGNYASFSSRGPTYDGRVKPNVVAQGSSSTVISAWSGNVSYSSGTSFSSPITAGMVACLWQAHPNRKNTEIMAAIEQSGSQATNPDDYLGYGIPDYFAAHTTLSVPVIHNIQLDIKIYLEGAYQGISMNSLPAGLVPLNQPYNSPPFNYNGTEQVFSVPGNDIVDWIYLELRDTTSSALADQGTKVAQRAAFLKSDGSVVDLDGNSLVSFNLPIKNNLYLVIRHRNHLGVISSAPLANSGSDVYFYDFTTHLGTVLGGNNGFKEIAAGVFGLVSGDANADGTITFDDLSNSWAPSAGESVYHTGDFNLDGQIDNVDKDDFWTPNTVYTEQIPD